MDWTERAEQAANRLADLNLIEEAWYLRGVIDALAGARPDQGALRGPHGEHYDWGYRVTSNWDKAS